MINEGDAACHYGDHYWQANGRCSNCDKFNGDLLVWKRFEKADREGRATWHGDHWHTSPSAAARCRFPEGHGPVETEATA